MNNETNMFAPIRERILHCDSACIVVNKIAGEAVEGAGRGMHDLPRLLALELEQSNVKDALPLPAAVHRLDVPVSGCVLFARTQQALRLLSAAFNDNKINKSYWAIIEKPDNDNLVARNEGVDVVHWIAFDRRRNKSIAYNEPGNGRKKAILRYRVAGSGRDYLFLEVELFSGRHHQIRAQFEQLGLRIKGDLKYGARRSEKNGGIRLHARSITFPAPDGSGPVTVQADPPLRDNLWLAFAETVHV